MSDIIPVFSHCPRCGEKAYDVLRTHAYCVDCNFSPDLEDYERVTTEWASSRVVDFKKAPKKISKRSKTQSKGEISWK